MASSRSADSVDVMNDPAFDTNPARKAKGREEPDTCRICRGEGAAEEPLFHPCKCSGSIKFVHQACLMDWLAHSHKKHCELCKTPFRFTKLYRPDMPPALPAAVFARQAAVHAARTAAAWARWLLVAAVWLGWVPWCMRCVWRWLFWLGDGSWTTSQLVARSTTALRAVNGTRAPALPKVEAPAAASMTWFVKIAYRSFLPSISIHTTWSLPNGTSTPTEERHPSLLSDVGFLRSASRWRTLNDLCLDIVEGQIITTFMIVTFVLVFLIREWVVQQQPGLNAGAAIERMMENPPVPPPAAQPLNNDAQAAPRPAPDGPADTTLNAATQRQDPQLPNRDVPADRTGTDSSSDRETSRPRSQSAPATRHAEESGSRQARPELPPRDTLSGAVDVHRNLEENVVQRPPVEPRNEPVVERADWGENDQVPPARELSVSERLEQIKASAERLREASEARRALLAAESLPIASQAPSDERGDDADTTGEADQSRFNVPDQAMSSTFRSDPGRGESDTAGSQSKDGSPRVARAARLPKPTDATDQLLAEGEASVSHEELMQRLQQPFEDSDDEMDHFVGPAPVAPAPVAPAPVAPAPVAPAPSQQIAAPADHDAVRQGTWEQLANWLWGGVPNNIVPQDERADAPAPHEHQDDERIVHDVANEAPFVARGDGQLMLGEEREENQAEQDGERQPAAVQADGQIDANEVEGVEDVEDLEGVMDLIGMQGPLLGLLQNGIFSTILVSLALIIFLWMPYITGKFVLVVAANPLTLLVKFPFKILSAMADFADALVVFLLGCITYWLGVVGWLLTIPMSWIVSTTTLMKWCQTISNSASKYALDAAQRLGKSAVVSTNFISEADVPIFSIVAHEALRNFEIQIVDTMKAAVESIYRFAESPPTLSGLIGLGLAGLSIMVQSLREWIKLIVQGARALSLSALMRPSLSMEIPKRTQPLDFSLAYWDATDRVITVALGYLALLLLGAAILKLKIILEDTPEGNNRNRFAIQALGQTGGVLKVVLIISIEMIVFPLYCGILLDVALLPLFKDATLLSRLNFTAKSPATSVFVHWFVGTCYMFHFALFVSMCRDIMRTGVLYFIRDPDDPSFHPVRDVLERNVYTQLRKIAFSALVYGALVVFCLGAVVWGVASAFTGVFPIHWSSSQPVLEFPLDLLVYNFIMPRVLKFVRPSDGLKKMYEWWFRKCARALRLSHFLFYDRQEDEEGHFKRSLAEREKQARSQDATPEPPLAANPSFIRDGRFVRAPASDQVKIPKGGDVFVDVDEDNNRLNGQPDADHGSHGRQNQMFTQVYIPPHFSIRISLFVVLLWAFTACTGVGITMAPLLFGRLLFRSLMPHITQVNDLYALTVGAYALGAPLYIFLRYRRTLSAFLRSLRTEIGNMPIRHLTRPALKVTLHVLRLAYVYGAIIILIPTLFALLFEAYFIIPLHTYLSHHPGLVAALSQANTTSTDATTGTAATALPTSSTLLAEHLPFARAAGPLAPPHTIHFLSDWTLGVLLTKALARRLLLAAPPGAPGPGRAARPAAALRAIVAPANRGSAWWDPDARLATRALVLPAVALLGAALLAPLALGAAANAAWFARAGPEARAVVYRLSYPAALALACAALLARAAAAAVGRWKMRVRDEVYLIGERLHNFGEKRGGERNVRPRRVQAGA